MPNGEGSSSRPPPAVDFTAGVIAGAAGLVVGQPFDVVKVRYQTPEFNGRYTSVWRAFGSIVKEERVQGLFKGVTSPMFGIAFINGVVFTSYSVFMKLQLRPDSGQEPSLGQICLAGAGSGIIGALLTCPTELIKIRQQSAPPHLNPSTLSVCRSILRTDGLRGLYRGFSATAIRDIAYGPYFGTYEGVCRFFKWMKPPPMPSTIPEEKHSRRPHYDNLIAEAEDELQSLSWGELMTAGGLAGVTAWIVTFPADVIKTRMQAASWNLASEVVPGQSGGQISKRKPPGFVSVAREAIRNEGWRVMFAGLGPTLIRAVPVNMVVFVCFEACVAAMSQSVK